MSKEFLKYYSRDKGLPLQDFSQAKETGPGRALLQAAEWLLSKEREALEDRPMRGQEDVTKGVEFRLGFINGMRRLLALPDEARRYLDELTKDSKEK